MSPRTLNVFLLAALTSLPLIHASNLRAGQHAPAPTAAPKLFMRQDGYTCDAGQTACTDGGGGCCDIGAACGFENGIPICEEGCGLGPTCSGILDGLCCNVGYTCNYQSTLCETDVGGGGGGGGGGGASLTETFPSDTQTDVFPTAAPTTSVETFSTPSLLPSPTVTDTFPSDTAVSSVENTLLSTSQSTDAFSFPSETPVPTPTIVGGGGSTTTPTQTAQAGGQSRLAVGMKLLLAVQGLNFFWA